MLSFFATVLHERRANMTICYHCQLQERLPFDFAPDLWEEFWNANCYEYLLNFRNSSETQLKVGSVINREFQPYQSDLELITILKDELSEIGFSMENSNNSDIVPDNKMKFFVSRSRCGDYHFYRLDSNGKWSHKFGFEKPTNLNFMGQEIILPELACSTDRSVGYFLLGINKE